MDYYNDDSNDIAITPIDARAAVKHVNQYSSKGCNK